MYQYFFRQWKTRKMTVLLIIIGFFVGSVVMSIGTSACVESFQYVDDTNRGNPEEQLDLFVSYDGTYNKQGIEKIVEKLGELGEIQFLSMPAKNIGKEKDYTIVPVLFRDVPDWHVPIMKGRYFDKESMKAGNKELVIGKSVADDCGVNVGDVVSIQGEDFRVIGICGRKTRETSWEYALYMSWENYNLLYPDSFQEFTKGKSLSIHLEKGKNEFMGQEKEFRLLADESGLNLVYENVSKIDRSSVKNTVIIATTATILVFLVAVANIIHLMLYWVLERKKAIGIMKALGANNGYIARCLLMEILVMAGIGCLLAVLAQYLAVIILEGTKYKGLFSMQISYINLLCAMAVAMFFGIISSFIPIKRALKFEPVKIINSM